MNNPIARWARILWRALRNFSIDHGANHAAAVAYFSLLSFPPLILFAGRLVAHLLSPETAGDQVIAAIAPFLPTEIASSLGDVTASLTMNGAVLVVALPALFWVASHAFSAIEIAVNVAYGTTPQRRFILSRLKAFAGLFGGVVVLAGTAVASHLALLASRYYELTGAPPLFSPRERLASGLAHAAPPGSPFRAPYGHQGDGDPERSERRVGYVRPTERRVRSVVAPPRTLLP